MNKMRELQILLLKIPKTKVTSYKILAKKLKIHPIIIGKLLSKNPNPEKYSCYKIVYSDGKIGGYSKGVNKKIQKLKRDGIEVKNKRIDIKRFLFRVLSNIYYLPIVLNTLER